MYNSEQEVLDSLRSPPVINSPEPFLVKLIFVTCAKMLRGDMDSAVKAAVIAKTALSVWLDSVFEEKDIVH